MHLSPFAFHVDLDNSTIVAVDGVAFSRGELANTDEFEIWLDHGLVTIKLDTKDDGQLGIYLLPRVGFDDAAPEPFEIDTRDLEIAAASFDRLWRNADHPHYVYLSLGAKELHIKAESEGVVFDVWEGDKAIWTAACAFDDVCLSLPD